MSDFNPLIQGSTGTVGVQHSTIPAIRGRPRRFPRGPDLGSDIVHLILLLIYDILTPEVKI